MVNPKVNNRKVKGSRESRKRQVKGSINPMGEGEESSTHSKLGFTDTHDTYLLQNVVCEHYSSATQALLVVIRPGPLVAPLRLALRIAQRHPHTVLRQSLSQVR